MCDAPLYQTRQQSIIFGARGVTPVDVTVYGPRAELHSGHYGNWAPNPALSLARLLASMKDDNGRVLVDALLRRGRAARARWRSRRSPKRRRSTPS